MNPIIAQLIALFVPILTDALRRWLESLLQSVHRPGMDELATLDAAIATLPGWSLRPRTWRRRALLRRMRAAVAARVGFPMLNRALTADERHDLRPLAEAAA